MIHGMQASGFRVLGFRGLGFSGLNQGLGSKLSDPSSSFQQNLWGFSSVIHANS